MKYVLYFLLSYAIVYGAYYLGGAFAKYLDTAKEYYVVAYSSPIRFGNYYIEFPNGKFSVQDTRALIERQEMVSPVFIIFYKKISEKQYRRERPQIPVAVKPPLTVVT